MVSVSFCAVCLPQSYLFILRVPRAIMFKVNLHKYIIFIVHRICSFVAFVLSQNFRCLFLCRNSFCLEIFLCVFEISRSICAKNNKYLSVSLELLRHIAQKSDFSIRLRKGEQQTHGFWIDHPVLPTERTSN